MNRSFYFLIVLAGSAFFFGAAFWLYQSWQERVRLGLKSLDWPTTPAVFENGYVSFEGSVAQKNKRANYVIVTGYRYEVEGVSHYNNVRSATTIAYASREEAEAALAEFPRENLLAHYNPENPGEAVLEPGVSIAYRLLVVMPVLLVLVGLFLLGSGLRTLITGKT